MNLTELDDRYESELKIGDFDVSLSVDKPVSDKDLSLFKDVVSINGLRLLNDSQAYLESKRSEYNLDHATDLGEPQIIWGNGLISVYWYSENGEDLGASILGVDFNVPCLSPVDITVGD